MGSPTAARIRCSRRGRSSNFAVRLCGDASFAESNVKRELRMSGRYTGKQMQIVVNDAGERR